MLMLVVNLMLPDMPKKVILPAASSGGTRHDPGKPRAVSLPPSGFDIFKERDVHLQSCVSLIVVSSATPLLGS